nr:uncharacterized protein LOC105321518 isoform X4 [Crassostrea gigas]
MPGSVLQIMGEVFSGVAGVFLIIASVGQDWVEVQFFRTTHVITWGLWDICVGGLCLPDSGWLEICRGLILLAVLLSLGAFLCGLVGLCIHSHCSKRAWFILAGALMSLVAHLSQELMASAGPTNPDSVPSHVQLGHCPLTNRQPLDVHPQNLEL